MNSIVLLFRYLNRVPDLFQILEGGSPWPNCTCITGRQILVLVAGNIKAVLTSSKGGSYMLVLLASTR